MNVRVRSRLSAPKSQSMAVAIGPPEYEFPSRYVLLHARGISLARVWPPTSYGPGVISAFRVLPVTETHLKAGLGSAEVLMSSIKNRRELTDTIPIVQLTQQVLETYIEGLTSWEVVSWAKEYYSERHQLPDGLVQLTIVAKIETNERGDFVYRRLKPRVDWTRVLVILGLVFCFLGLVMYLLYGDV